jgi:hypothetical protein
MRKRKDQKNAGNILHTHIHWHIMDTIIFVIPMLSIAISTSLRIWLKTILGFRKHQGETR